MSLKCKKKDFSTKKVRRISLNFPIKNFKGKFSVKLVQIGFAGIL